LATGSWRNKLVSRAHKRRPILGVYSWSLGNKYLAGGPELIGDWPDVEGNYSDKHEVWAVLYRDGVITYYDKPKPEKDKSFEFDLELPEPSAETWLPYAIIFGIILLLGSYGIPVYP